jgi:hypothetical protein
VACVSGGTVHARGQRLAARGARRLGARAPGCSADGHVAPRSHHAAMGVVRVKAYGVPLLISHHGAHAPACIGVDMMLIGARGEGGAPVGV